MPGHSRSVPIVLIGGAWLGGWCWRRVTPFLREAGHDVYTPTLTGLGERRHLAHPDIDLNTHVQDIVNVLEFEDLNDVVLVGHSYSGMVISGVRERAPERTGHIVYIDASVPQDGESFFGNGPSRFRDMVEADARAHGDGWRWPMPDFDTLSQFASLAGLTDADRQWFRSNATPQPVNTMTQPLRVSNQLVAAIPRTYICCTDELRDRSGWHYRELATGHWPMFSTPQPLADLILEAA